MLGLCMVIAWPMIGLCMVDAWPILGMGSHYRDLGMN